MAFSDNLKMLRREKGWTQSELAEAAGLKISHIPKLENPNADPKLSTIYKLVMALGCATDTLLMDPRRIDSNARLKRIFETLDAIDPERLETLISVAEALYLQSSIDQQMNSSKVVEI